MAWDQVTLADPPMQLPDLRASGSGAEPTIDVDDDGSVTVRLGDDALIAARLAATLWRAPTDNDGIVTSWSSGVSGIRRRWEQWGLHQLRSEITSERAGTGGSDRRIERRLIGADHEARHRTDITVARGGVRFDERIQIPDEWFDLPRVGVRFEVPAELVRLEWFGPGPVETYPDRAESAMVARWSSSVPEQYHPFVVPQEHGAHVQTRWFELTSTGARGLRVDADRPFMFSARRHHDAALTAASTIAELSEGETTEVHVDMAMRGLGTGACGPDTRPDYLVRPGVHTWSWSLRPLC